MEKKALQGLKIADFSWYIAGPSIAMWLAHHGAEVIRIESLTKPDELRAIEEESSRNTAGMVAGTLGEDVNGRSDAIFGGELVEGKLKEWIENEEPGVRQCFDQPFPFEIRWDYYGQRS